ncbi:type VII secretion protein EccE [Mycobacterium angelicum]|uniref:Type VII secretion protein EccE n=1 Tax=Mycobacterium angelicum TaxID=470074 RepID=A0A1W9ZS13_MYCAN|nr:type VII secretion protein EccE [Mycobacterium angelicum]ORA20589.1 type VII secretion protein EccE [Mycobacterium angelicum]
MSIPRPGSGRISLALLAVVPAALAYPWQTTRDYWLLGIAAGVLIVLFGWWRELYFTTMLRRRFAIIGRRRGVTDSGSDTRSTALLWVKPPAADTDLLPLPLIASYLDAYGIRADTIRITSRDTSAGERQTWIGLTISAADNLAALQARSARIPLHETAEVAARRLADHLREIGWDAGTVVPEDVPVLVAADARETWTALRQGDSDYLTAYGISDTAELPETLAAIRAHPARETWTALQIAGDRSNYTIAAACAFRTDEPPAGAPPVAGLTAQRGQQLPALLAMDPPATRRLAAAR